MFWLKNVKEKNFSIFLTTSLSNKIKKKMLAAKNSNDGDKSNESELKTVLAGLAERSTWHGVPNLISNQKIIIKSIYL